MQYYDTTYQLVKTYTGAAWWSGLQTHVLASYSANTVVRHDLATWNQSWFIILPQKSRWDFLRYNYYYNINGFKTISGTGYAKLFWYDHAVGSWNTIESSLITVTPHDTYRVWWSGVLDMSAVTDVDDLYCSPTLYGSGSGYIYMGGASVIGIPKC